MSLRKQLERLALSQATLARLVGVTPRAVSTWMADDKSPPAVDAYLRLFEASSDAMRARELARLIEEDMKMREGIYRAEYQGVAGLGVCLLVLENGVVCGSDWGGGRYDGTYEVNRSTGLIDVRVVVTMPPGVPTVQGVPALATARSFNVKVSFPRKVANQVVTATTDDGPVKVRMNFLRELVHA